MARKLHVVVDKRIVRLLAPYPKDKLLPFWSYSVPNFRFISRRFPNWDGKVKLLKYDKVPLGLFLATRKDIQSELGIRFKKHVTPTDGLDQYVAAADYTADVDKYKFQTLCVQAMIDAGSKGGGLLINATGSGKTRVAAMYCQQVKCPILFVVDQLDLLHQAKNEIQNYLHEKVGMVGESVFKPRRVTVATVQTLHAHRTDPKFSHWTSNLKVIIIDEIHVQMNRRNFDVVTRIQPIAVYGLTATLELKKKPVRLRAWSLAGPVIFEYPLVRGMQSGVLSLGVCLRLQYQNPSPGAAKRPTGDGDRLQPLCSPSNHANIRHQATSSSKHVPYRILYDDKVVCNAERNHLIASLVRYAYKHKRYAIVLVRRLRHMTRLSNRLNRLGIPHKLVAGTVRGEKLEVSKRHQIKQHFESGKIRVIIANQVFTKGIDIKRVDVIIDAAAMKSKNDAIQKFGRGIRVHKHKKGLVFIDIADVDPYPQYIAIKHKHKHSKSKSKTKTVYNSLHQASASRKRAYSAAGIRVLNINWDECQNTREVFRSARTLLQKEQKKHHARSQ